MSRADVVVIGGGVVGIACAAELAGRGASVRVLESGRIGGGCSFGNAGWLSPSAALPLARPGQMHKVLRWLFDSESPFYIRPRADPALVSWLVRFVAASRRGRFERSAAALVDLCRFSVDAWEELARNPEAEPFGFERNGLVAIYESPSAWDAARAAAAQTERWGVPYEIWTADEVRRQEPAVRGRQLGAVFFPEDARCEPYPAVRALAAVARRAGVELSEGFEVLGVDRTSSTIRAVRTTYGTVHAREFVLAAGAWSGSLGRKLGIKIPMLGAKGYSLVVPPLDPHPRRALFLAERKIAINPHADSLRISGTLELVGEDLSINWRRLEAVAKGAGGILELGDPLGKAEIWRGLRPCLPDGMPVIGRARGCQNLWLATGHQMTGLKTAPGTGRLLAELMGGHPPTFDPFPFRADRYGTGSRAGLHSSGL
jgi:D-amino-acid dehydrogenase